MDIKKPFRKRANASKKARPERHFSETRQSECKNCITKCPSLSKVFFLRESPDIKLLRAEGGRKIMLNIRTIRNSLITDSEKDGFCFRSVCSQNLSTERLAGEMADYNSSPRRTFLEC